MTTTSKCLGIRVRYDERLKPICDSRGLFRWKEIVVGPLFMRFPPREQEALLLHEAGHCKLRHLEKRLARLWLIVWPHTLAKLCRQQEFEADWFASRCGYGADLARAFARLSITHDDPLHPPVAQRIERLLQLG